MKCLYGFSGIALLSAAALASANAADLYQPAAPGGYKDAPAYAAVNWSGLYAGVNGGGGWSANSDQLANSPGLFSGLSPSGGFGGGQIGYNWQRDRLVFGIETDLEGSGIADSATDITGAKFKSGIDWFGTLRGRFGYALDHSLIYATAGLAYGNVNNRAVSPSGDIYKNDGTETGYVVGAGLEYKISPSWSIKGEYQYVNLGSNGPVDAAGSQYSNAVAGVKVNDDAFHSIRFGLNYQFGTNDLMPLK